MAVRGNTNVHIEEKRIHTLKEEKDTKDDNTFDRLKYLPMPDKVKALPHVLGLITALAMTPEEALKEALATHRLDRMERIMNRFECYFTETMVQAAATNQRDVVALVLTVGFNIRGRDLGGVKSTDETMVILGKAIVAGAQNGHLDIVELLLLWTYPFPTMRDAMDAAAANGHLNVVEFMVQHAVTHRYSNQYSFCSSCTLSKAILGGHPDVAEFLVNRTRIYWDLKSAYAAAIDQGQIALAGRIYEIYPQRIRGRNLFLDLASSGHLEAVRHLYNNGCDGLGLVGKACVSAAHNSKNDVVKFLVSTGRVNAEMFDKAFKRACSEYMHDTTDTVMLLYNLKRVSSQAINRGFESSSNVAIMKFLCDKENISNKAITTAFMKALSPPNLKVILFLYKKPCIPSESIDAAFMDVVRDIMKTRFACSFCALEEEAVSSLKDDKRLSSKALGEAYMDVVKYQNVDMMKLVYDERRTPGEALVQALMESAHHERIDLVKNIVKLLAAKPRKFMHDAFVAAARHGQMSILEIVYQSQPADLPLKVLGAALDVAGGNGKMENFIRKLVCDQIFKERLPK